MEDEKKIKFSAEGTGLFNFIKQAKASFDSLQKDGKNLADMFAAQAKVEGLANKESFRYIQDMLKAMREQLKIQKELTKERLEQNKQAQYENDMNSGKAGYWDRAAQLNRKEVDLVNTLKNYQNQERTINQAGIISSRNQQDLAPSKQSFFNDIIKAGVFRDIMGALRQTTSASTGLDLVPSMLGIAGASVGGLTGALIDAANVSILGNKLGDIHASTVLSNLGKDLATTGGQGYVRHITEKERYEAAANAVYGLTGRRSQAGDLSMYGMDLTTGANLEQSIIRAIGTATTQDQIRNVAAISRFGNIDQSSILGLMRTSRMGGGYNEKDIVEMFSEGMNRSQLNEGTQKLTSILQHQSQYMGSLAGSNAMLRVQIGDRLGGPFSTIDPRSTDLEMGYMSRLQNPQGSFEQAISFAALQKAYPGKSLLEYARLRQKGGVEYEKAVLDIYGQMTGNEDINTLLYSGSGFGSRVIDFDETRLKGRDYFSTIYGSGMGYNTQAPMSMDTAMSKVYSDAEKLTTEMQKNIASVNNAFVDSFTKGINEIAIQFKNRMMTEVMSFVLNSDDYRKAKLDLDKSASRENLNSLIGKKPNVSYTGDLDIYGNLVRKQ